LLNRQFGRGHGTHAPPDSSAATTMEGIV